jgi:hypothetical protein
MSYMIFNRRFNNLINIYIDGNHKYNENMKQLMRATAPLKNGLDLLNELSKHFDIRRINTNYWTVRCTWI